MSRVKIFALMALFTFALGLALAGDALAGERAKGRTVWYTVKWEQMDVGDEEGHIYGLYEAKGISTCLQGKWADGSVGREIGFLDMNAKTGAGTGHGWGCFTYRDGDKTYYRWEGKKIGDHWEGIFNQVKGTGKYEGIRSKGTYSSYVVAPAQYYANWEEEIELPRR